MESQFIQLDTISEHLKTTWLGSDIHYYPTIDSTNSEAKRLLPELKHGTVLLASHQSAGRGRFGKKWLSRENHSLACSLVLKPTQLDVSATLLTQLSAAALYNVLSKYMPAQIKWPNDLMSHNKKIAGILIETSYEGAHLSGIIVGVGVNLYAQTFDFDDLNQTVGSLEEFANHPFDPNIILAGFLNEFEQQYNAYIDHKDDSFLNICRNHSTLIGKKISIQDKEQKRFAEAVGLSNIGALEVIYEGKSSVEHIHLGEVSIRLV